MDYSYLQTMDTVFKSYFALDPSTGLPFSTGFGLVADGIGGILWQSPVSALSTFGGATGQPQLANLPSYMTSTTTAITGTSTFIGSTVMSTLNTLASNYAGFAPQVSAVQLASTVTTLGSVGYVSTSGLTYYSTTISTLISQVSTLQTQVSSLLQFSTSYASSLSTTFSTYTGGILVPALANIGTPPNGNPGNAFISSFSLISTIANLSSLGYVTGTQLQSTVNTLGTVGYVSTPTLMSTFYALSTLVKNTITIENPANNVIVNNSQVTFTSPTTIAYLSTLYLSSIPYTGGQGVKGELLPDGNSIGFSSLVLNFTPFAPFITRTSRIVLEYTPTFVFTRLSDNCTGFPQLNISTFLQNGPNYITNLLPSVLQNTPFAPTNYKTTFTGTTTVTVDTSNIFQVPLKIMLSTGQIQANINTPLALHHQITKGYSVFPTNLNGLSGSNVLLRMDIRTPVFLTIFNPAYA